jgi:hypothetical protein
MALEIWKWRVVAGFEGQHQMAASLDFSNFQQIGWK